MLEFSCHTLIWKIDWKINIHNVKIWTFRTSSSWENMTHETHMQLYSRQRTIFFAASVMTNVSSMSTYNTYILFLKDRKDAWGKNATNGNLSLLSFRWHCPRKNGDMNICIKKNFEWFLGPFLANQGQVRKKFVKKRPNFLDFYIFCPWIEFVNLDKKCNICVVLTSDQWKLVTTSDP